MNKPAGLTLLIEELRAEIIDPNVGTVKDSCATVYLSDEDAAKEDGIELSRQDCQLLLHSPSTVDQFFEALGTPKEASIELVEVDVSDDTMNELERRFIAVDEG